MKVAVSAAARRPPSGVAPWISAGALIATLVLAGCGGGDSPPQARPTATPGSPADRPAPTDEELVVALLADRAAALEAGRWRAYAATATGAQRRFDRVAGRRAARLRLRDVVLDADRVRVNGDEARAKVSTSYAIRGVQGTFGSVSRVAAVRTADGWRVAAMRDRRGRPPWEVAGFARRSSRHFVVLAPQRIAAGELLPALEEGYAAIRERLDRVRLRRRYLVIVAADVRQARALTVTVRGVEALAALADASVIQAGPARRTTRVISLRLLVVWPAYAPLDSVGRSRIVAHELTHAALTPKTSGRTPAWLAEGVALYVSGDRRPAPPGIDLADLSRPVAIAHLRGEAQAAAYHASSAAAFAIAERFGDRRLLALYDAFNDPDLRGRPGPRLVDRALRRTLGISLSELEAELG